MDSQPRATSSQFGVSDGDLNTVQELASSPGQHPPSRCWFDAAASPFKELHLQLPFEARDRLAQRGLRHRNTLGSPGEVQLLLQLHHVTKLLERHINHLVILNPVHKSIGVPRHTMGGSRHTPWRYQCESDSHSKCDSPPNDLSRGRSSGRTACGSLNKPSNSASIHCWSKSTSSPTTATGPRCRFFSVLWPPGHTRHELDRMCMSLRCIIRLPWPRKRRYWTSSLAVVSMWASGSATE